MKKYVNMLAVFVFVLIFISACNPEPVTTATSTDGVEISFSNQGKGKPAVLLVHGWTNNRSIWDLQVPVLSDKYQVIAIDLAGHGQSGNNREKWTMTAFGEDIAAAVKAAGLDDVILVGFSLGGPAIIEAAKLMPEEVSGLILVDAIQSPEAQFPPPMVQFIDSAFMDLIADPTVEKASRFGFMVNNVEEGVEKVKAMIDRDQTGWRDILHENFRWLNEDCSQSLQSVKVPVIAINTEAKNPPVDVFRKYVDDFEGIVIAGSGHVLMWDVTDEFNKTLLESIEKISVK